MTGDFIAANIADVTALVSLPLAEKRRRLAALVSDIAAAPSALAFSGGVDSGLLLSLMAETAKRQGTALYALIARTKLHPRGEAEAAAETARAAGAVPLITDIDELADCGIENNPRDRCYRCKRGLFQNMRELAAARGAKYLVEGTNADDLAQYRPGIKAISELGVISPLAACGLKKAEIRRLAAERGLAIAAKPSAPCLATRLPYGAKLDYELLARIDSAERAIRDMGFYDVRLRVHGAVARLEVEQKNLAAAVERRADIIAAVKSAGFFYVTLDLEGFRSGSMDAP